MITLITPTADQPTGIALMERWIARQTVQPDQWIVADDGDAPATLTMGQEHIVRARWEEGARSLAGNLLAALPHVRGDIVLIIEHDDWYAPDHIETCLAGLEKSFITGSRWQRYYNVAARRWIVMRNIGSALCNTALRVAALTDLEKAARQAYEKNSIGVDRLLWDRLMNFGHVTETKTVVGIKGLLGRKGLGLGHNPHGRAGWKDDPHGQILEQWIGADADHYLQREAA